MLDEPILRVSFLITDEDYINERIDFLSLGVTKAERNITSVFGILLILFGIAGALFFSNNGSDWIFWFLSILCGLCVLFYYDKIFPALNAYQARKDYANIKEKLFAQTFSLTEEGLEVASVRQTGRYPWDFLYRCVITEHSIIFYLGIGATKVLPLRLITEEKRAIVFDFLKDHLKNRVEEINHIF